MRAGSCLQFQKNGDLLFKTKRKGSNPTREKRPMLKCPICKKNLHKVYDAKVKNDAILFDIDNPRYKDFPRSHICKCSRCHRTIGIYYLTVKARRMMGMKLEHECHGKLEFVQN